MKNKVLGCCLISLFASSFSLSAYAGGDITRGKAKAATCAGCHGANGMGISGEFPNLAGQKQDYLVKQLHAFKSGNRIDPTMKAMTSSLIDNDILNLAAYYASLTPSSSDITVTNVATTTKATQHEFPKYVYITMKKSGTVETFPSETVWKGGPNMLYTAVTPNGNVVLSTSPSSNLLYVFDAASGKQLAIITVGKAPKGVKVTPDGKYAYVSNQGSANVSVVSLKSLKVVDTIKVKEGPHNARFTRDGKLAYVTLQGGAGIAVIDTVKRKMVRVIPVPGITGPHNLDLSFDEKTAYVRDFVHNIAVLDIKSGTVKKVIEVGNGHGGIDVSPDGRYVATAAIGADYISIINPKTLTVKNIKVGNGPHGIRASEDSRWIYVTITKDNLVVVIDAKSMKIEKKIAVGKFPFWIAVKNNP